LTERKRGNVARYKDAKCRLCRKEGVKLFLKGERCFSPKCPLEKKGAVPPGQHGQKRRGRVSEYGFQLREKQKAKRTYGILEAQFKNYLTKAAKTKKGTGLQLLRFLELRLDNVLFRGGLVFSRSVSRQLINHGFCLVDGKKVNIPSFMVKPGQIISLSTKGLNLAQVKKALAAKQPVINWLTKKAAVLKVERLPKREEMDLNINEQLIVEFYSR